MFPCVAYPEQVTLKWKAYNAPGLSHYNLYQYDNALCLSLKDILIARIPKGTTTYVVDIDEHKAASWRVYPESEEGIESGALYFITFTDTDGPGFGSLCIRHPGRK